MSKIAAAHTMAWGVSTMKDYYFTFRSVTRAMEAEKRLQRAGMHPYLLRTPAELRKKGCGYSLRLQEGEWEPARAVLTEEGYERLFRKNGGVWEEVRGNVF